MTRWIVLLVIAAAVYRPALQGDFYFDDIPNIVDNAAVHLKHFSLGELAQSMTGLSAGPLGRPVSVLSFGLTHLFFGLDPYAFKAINLGIHLLNGLLVGWFASLFLQALPAGRLSNGANRWLPFWIAAAWLMHPIQFVAVTMVVQRMTLLAGTFTLLALITHLKALALPASRRSKWGWFVAGWLVFWPLSFLSKESGLLFPGFALLVTALVGAPSIDARRVGFVFALASTGLVGLGMSWYLGWAWLESGYAVRTFTLQERLLTEPRVLWFYLGQVLAPSYPSFALYLDWFPVSKGLLSPLSTFVAVLAWVLAIAAAILLRRRVPMLAFGLGWFLVGHSLESSFIPLEIAHEHRNYLPALGPILALGFTVAQLLGRLKLENPRLTVGVVCLGSLMYLGLINWLRADQMSVPLVGTQIEATRHPNSARANHAAAGALMKAGYGDIGDPIGGNSIRFHFEQSEKADAAFKLGYLGLINWACASGRPVERQWLDALAVRLEHTPYAHGQKSLPAYLLKPIVHTPDCLTRKDALLLFTAGASNPNLDVRVRAQFLEAASDYELLVWRDLSSARSHLEASVALSPGDERLRQKLTGYNPSVLDSQRPLR